MEHVSEQGPDETAEYRVWVKEHKRRGLELFGSALFRDFFYYSMDSMGFLEHGSMIPGWLTDKGKDLLSDIQILEKSGYLDFPEVEE